MKVRWEREREREGEKERERDTQAETETSTSFLSGGLTILQMKSGSLNVKRAPPPPERPGERGPWRMAA